MTKNMTTRFVAATVAVGAGGASIALGSLVGAGAAEALPPPVSGDSPDWPNYRVGPFASQSLCDNHKGAYIRVSRCFWSAPDNRWYFWGETI